jgi:hypothetical protein
MDDYYPVGLNQLLAMGSEYRFQVCITGNLVRRKDRIKIFLVEIMKPDSMAHVFKCFPDHPGKGVVEA